MKKGLKAVCPPAVTEIDPELAPAGTGTVIEVVLQFVGVAAVPLNDTCPCDDPKLIPVIVTGVPAWPAVGVRLLITGVVSTVKLIPLLASPDTVTSTFPLVAAGGTGTVIDVALQLAGVAEVPLNVTALVPCVGAKFVPVMMIEVPATPEVGERLVMLGGGNTVKFTLLLFTPLAFTTTLPVVAPVGTLTTIDVALQLPIVVAAVPLKDTEPDP